MNTSDPAGWNDFDEAYSEPLTFSGLVVRFYESPQFRRLRPVSQGNYRRILDRFCEEHGQRPLAGLTRQRLTRIIGAKAGTPSAAQVLLKRLRTLFRFAMNLGWLSSDPSFGVRSYPSREFHTWTEGEIAQFEVRWRVGSKRRLAFALHLYTGQRRSDVHRMAWSDYGNGTIRVEQQKTGARLMVAVHPELARILDATERRGSTILVTEYGKQFQVADYGNWMSAAIRAAGLPPRCVTHGLRKAAARRLAEAGCSAPEIMAMTGHRCMSEADRYIRAADQERLARQAVRRQIESSGRAIS